MKWYASILAIPFFAAPVLVQPGVSDTMAVAESSATSCALMSNDAKRLNCYDGLFKPNRKAAVLAEKPNTAPVEKSKIASVKKSKTGPKPVSAKSSESLDLGNWKINAGKLSSDGTARVVIRVPSENATFDSKGNERDTYLYAACRSGRVTIWANFDQVLEVHPETVPVRMIFDGGDTETILMRNSYDWRSVGIWDDAISKNLLKRLEKTQRLTITADRAVGNAVQADFRVSKLSNALKPVEQACGWKRSS